MNSSSKQCPYCKKRERAADATICPQCGRPRCPHCKEILPGPELEICPECHEKIPRCQECHAIVQLQAEVCPNGHEKNHREIVPPPPPLPEPTPRPVNPKPVEGKDEKQNAGGADEGNRSYSRVMVGGIAGAIMVAIVAGILIHIGNSNQGSTVPVQPVIKVFTATPTEVTKGGKVTIHWEVENADNVELAPFGQVLASGNSVDQPQRTTIYTLSATNKSGGKSGTFQEVIVNEPKPPIVENKPMARPSSSIPDFAGIWQPFDRDGRAMKSPSLKITQNGTQLTLNYHDQMFSITSNGKATERLLQALDARGYVKEVKTEAAANKIIVNTLRLEGPVLIWEQETTIIKDPAFREQPGTSRHIYRCRRVNAATPATANTPVFPAPSSAEPTAIIHTSAGDLHCKLFEKEAPETVKNFIGLSDGTRAWKNPVSHAAKKGVPLYDGTIFHRVIPKFMIQGGDPAGNGAGDPGYKFKDEIVSTLTFDRPGRLAMANSGPNTNGSQFFITEVPTPHLNGRHTIFGQCDAAAVALVKQIARMSADPSNNRPFHPVKITHIEIRGGAAPAAKAQPTKAAPKSRVTKG